MNPPTGLVFNAFYSAGDWNGYCNLTWISVAQPAGTVPVYRVEYHDLSTTSWIWLTDAPPGQGDTYGVPIRFAAADPGGGNRFIVSDQVRVTAIDTLGVSTPAAVTLATPAITPAHDAASDIDVVCNGYWGNETGSIDVVWDDLSMFVNSGRLILTKYGVSSPGLQRIILDNSFISTPSVYGPNQAHLTFGLLNIVVHAPAGDLLRMWDPYNPPTEDPNAPFLVNEGDLLTLTIITNTDDDVNPIITETTFSYYHQAQIIPWADVAYQGLAYVPRAVQVYPAPDGTPTIATLVYVSGLPPGMDFNTSNNTIEGTPTATGQFAAVFDVTSQGNKTTRQQVISIWVNNAAVASPTIVAPPTPLRIPVGFFYPTDALSVYGPGPGAYSYTGTLPPGLSFNNATGAIGGSPTTVGDYPVVFTKMGPLGAGPNYSVDFQIVAETGPPVINAGNTMTAFIGQAASKRLTTVDNSGSVDVTIPATTEYRGFDLPQGLTVKGNELAGVAGDLPDIYIAYVQAKNIWGWGPLYKITITVDYPPPVIASAAQVSVLVGQPVEYQIDAVYYAYFYAADGLPAGLTINPTTGLISGTPTAIGMYTVNVTAVGLGGAATLSLAITVALPAVPVIDASTLQGRAITLQVNESFIFQPSASNFPTRWSADPLQTGISLDTATGKLFGRFLANGFYSITFVASNAGGDSAPETFYFLVGLAALQAGVPPTTVTSLDVVDLWVNLDNGMVTTDSASQSPGQGSDTQATATVKRGDTTVVNIILHKDGTPQNLTLINLFFGAKVDFDDDYIVYTNEFRRTGIGTFRVYPDFSDQNNKLDAVLKTAQTQLIGEIQWDAVDRSVGTGESRRSSQTFGVLVLRDLIHPDPTLGPPGT